MINKLMSLLRCSKCKGQLIKQSNKLTCTQCKKVYPIKNRIPIFVDFKKLPDHSIAQINYFESEVPSRQKFILQPWEKRYIDNFLKFGKPKKSGIIIDNATGCGYMAIELAKKGYSVIATDLTYTGLVTLQYQLKEFGLQDKVLLVCASSDELPIKSKIADGLTANAILEHLDKEKQAIKEIKRVLKNHTPLMLAMPIKYRYVWPFLWLVNWITDKRLGHLRRYDRESIITKFRGFKEITTYYTGSLIKVMFVGLFILTKIDKLNELGELFDEKFSGVKYGSNNIVSILRKG